MFEQGISELYEKRWSVVQEFLSQAWPLLLVLRRVWNRTSLPPTSRAFAADGEGRAFSVAAFEATLDNNLFFSYYTMAKTLHSVVHGLAAWAEGCHCHEPLARGRRRYAHFKALAADFGKEHYGCPLEAMRFPEFVAGGLIEAQKDIQHIAQVDLLQDSSIWCSPAEWQLVLSDFRMAQAAFALDFQNQD